MESERMRFILSLVLLLISFHSYSKSSLESFNQKASSIFLIKKSLLIEKENSMLLISRKIFENMNDIANYKKMQEELEINQCLSAQIDQQMLLLNEFTTIISNSKNFDEKQKICAKKMKEDQSKPNNVSLFKKVLEKDKNLDDLIFKQACIGLLHKHEENWKNAKLIGNMSYTLNNICNTDFLPKDGIVY